MFENDDNKDVINDNCATHDATEKDQDDDSSLESQ